MKVNDLDMIDLSELMDKYKDTHKRVFSHLIMSMENNQLSIAKYYGGYHFNGHSYRCVSLPETSLRFNSPKHWIGIEESFYKWISKQPHKDKAVKIDSPKQMEML